MLLCNPRSWKAWRFGDGPSGYQVLELHSGNWTDPGSLEFLQEFVKTAISELPSWVQYCSWLTRELGDDFSLAARVSGKDTPYLGRGAQGVVFECKISGEETALKVGKAEQLRAEAFNYGELSQIASVAESVARLVEVGGEKVCLCRDGYGSLFVRPAGRSLNISKKEELAGAEEALKTLHDAGLKHGDTRTPNFIVVDNRVLLIDFRTMEKIAIGIDVVVEGVEP